MNEVFRQAAYGKFAITIPISVTLTRVLGDKKERPYTSPYSIFNKDDLEAKAVCFWYLTMAQYLC